MLRLELVKKSYREPNGELLRILDIPKFELDKGEQMVLLGRSGGQDDVIARDRRHQPRGFGPRLRRGL